DVVVLHQYARDLVGPVDQIAVAPPLAARRDQACPLTSEWVGGHVDQLDRAVEPVGIAQLGKIEHEVGPLISRREVVPAERVQVGRRMKPYGLVSAHAVSIVYL